MSMPVGFIISMNPRASGEDGLTLATSYFGRSGVQPCPLFSLEAATADCPCRTPKPTGIAITNRPAAPSRHFRPALRAVPDGFVMMRTIRFFKSAPDTPETHAIEGFMQNEQTFRMLSAYASGRAFCSMTF